MREREPGNQRLAVDSELWSHCLHDLRHDVPRNPRAAGRRMRSRALVAVFSQVVRVTGFEPALLRLGKPVPLPNWATPEYLSTSMENSRISAKRPFAVISNLQNRSSIVWGGRAAYNFVILRIAPHYRIDEIMIRCHLSTLMGRDKLRISDVAQRTGLNRSTVTALYNEAATRVPVRFFGQQPYSRYYDFLFETIHVSGCRCAGHAGRRNRRCGHCGSARHRRSSATLHQVGRTAGFDC